MTIHEIIEKERGIVIHHPYRDLARPFLWIGKEERRRGLRRMQASNVVKRMLLAVRGCKPNSGIPLPCNRGAQARNLRAAYRVR